MFKSKKKYICVCVCVCVYIYMYVCVCIYIFKQTPPPKKNSQEKRSDLWLPEVVTMDEDGQKVQTPKYKMNKSWDVMYSMMMMTIVNTAAWYIWYI